MVGDAWVKDGARFGMRPGADRPSGVMQEQRQIKNERGVKFFEKSAMGSQLSIVCLGQSIQFVDAKECVLVCGVAMEKLVLNETRELAELRNVAAEKIHSMHQAKNAPSLAFSPQNVFEHFARGLGVLISARELPQMPGQRIR